MKKQILNISIYQLRRFIENLERKNRLYCFENNLDYKDFVVLNDAPIKINIINKKGLSDTWEIEE